MTITYEQRQLYWQNEDLVINALAQIADEENVYKGNGDYDTVPTMSAEQMQSLAREVLCRLDMAGRRPI